MRDVDLAYLAGVIDADGYVTATRSEHRPEGGVPWLPVGHDRTATFSQRVDEIRAAGRELDGRGWDEYPS